MNYTRSLEDDNERNSLSDLMTKPPMTEAEHLAIQRRKVEQRRRLEDYLEELRSEQ